MIKICRGSIFNSKADALVNPVNLEGVSGKGLAFEFAYRYPSAQMQYIAACQAKTLYMGTVLIVPTWDVMIGRDRLIVYAPTKKMWRWPSMPEYVEQTLDAITYGFPTWGIKSIALPALGCGLGGLNFEYTVLPIMERTITHLDATVEVFAPR